MAWTTSFKSTSTQEEADNEILLEAKKRFKYCEKWETQARVWFEYDYKFANADSNNMFQWDNWVVGDRLTNDRPCLTINKTQQHNLQIINDGKQNKPGVNIRPVGDEASFEAAQVFQEVVRHIEYISNAENVYDYAAKFQVDAGWGYWRVDVEKIKGSFDKEIKIKRIKDPRSVYMDPDTNEVDRSDAWYGFVFDDMPKDLYQAKYPKFKDVGSSTFNDNTYQGWLTKDHVRVAEYFRKTQEDDKLVYFVLPETGEEIGPISWSKLDKDGKLIFKEIKARENNLPEEEKTYKEQDELTEKVEWFLIAGNVIIDRKPWLGSTIPIVPLVGTETIIDGIWDCKGHTRALLDPQRIYNINSSANVEFGALQTKAPIMAPADAVQGHEEYYNTANRVNHAWIPYNHIDDEGNPIPPPQRMQAPVSSPAYVEQMKIAQEEMMMVSGQYQAQMGENENAKSGVAINARQRQGDRATYHFIDNQAIAIRRTGNILIDLIPKIFDTKRVMRIEAKDNTIMNVTIDPNHDQPYSKVDNGQQQPQTDNTQQIVDIIFNPNVGKYAVQSDTGPSFATRRQEAFNALTQIAAQNKEFMGIAGDILWKVADFPEAQVLAQRWRKIIPPNITGDAPNPQLEQAMHQAADKIEQQLALIAQQQKELADRSEEFRIKHLELDLKLKTADAEASRLDYEAETRRLTAAGNAGPGISIEQIQPIVAQLVRGMLNAGASSPGDEGNDLPGPHEGGTPIGIADLSNGQEEPPVPGAKKAKDGEWYVKNGKGNWLQVQPVPEAAGNA